jgi:hypothetical protein
VVNPENYHTMRKAILLLLCCSYLFPSYSQPSNDLCENAQTLELQLPGSCPSSFIVSDTFLLDNTGATASQPYPNFEACSGSPTTEGADIWVRFNALGNTLNLSVRGALQAPQIMLFQGNNCELMYPVACASGQGSVDLLATVDRNSEYYVLIAGQGIEDQGAIELIISSTNICNTCITERQGYFSASPAPQNGTYPGGQTVQMCYTVNRWNAGATGEFLHALELDFGPGWDATSFIPQPPNSCSDNGFWDWYDSWSSISTNQSFGPGFAYDAADFGFLDGNPGNNRGMGGNFCGNIGITSPPIEFCWTITTDDCPEDTYGYLGDLEVNARMLGDGLSGSWAQTQCFIPAEDDFLASIYCPDPFTPEYSVTDASCFDSCDGAVNVNANGTGPWEYTLTDISGLVIYSNLNSTGVDTIDALCAGSYELSIYDLASDELRTAIITIIAPDAPIASATFDLPCYEGEPIRLSGTSTPSEGATYEWFGPNDFYSTNQNPLTIYSGNYMLIVTVGGCSSEPFEFEVPSLNIPVVEIAEDTIIACPGNTITLSAGGNADNFTWFLVGANTPIGTGSSIEVTPEDGATYQVNGTNDLGCAGSDIVNIQIPLDPSLSTDNQGVVCPGTDVVLTAGGGLSYSWSTGDTTSSITVSPEFTALYYVTITGEGCTATLSQNIFVSNSFSLFISPDASICVGESIDLFAGGGESVEWSTGETSSPITVMPDVTTTYTAIITDENGCVHEKMVTVSVFPTPDFTIVPDNPSICEGDTISLLVLEGGSPYWDTIVWPTQTTTYPIPGAAFFGCQELESVTVTVNPLPEVMINGDDLLCGTDSTLLTVTGDGTFEWSTGEMGDSIYVIPTGTETYSVTATNSEGCQQDASVTVTQSDPPEAPVVTCDAGLSYIIFQWPVNIDYTYGLSIISGPPGVPVGNNQYIVSGLNPEESVTISLSAANAAGCTSSTTITCTTLSCNDIEVILDTPSEMCINDPIATLNVQISNGSNAGQGFWSGNGVTGDGFDPAVAGIGEHQITYAYIDNSCVYLDTTYIQVAGALTEEMVTCEAGDSSITFTWPAIAADTAYEVIVLSGQDGEFIDPTTFVVNGLQNGEEVEITIVSLGNEICGSISISSSCVINSCPELVIRPDTLACAGDPIQLGVEDSGWDSFSWSPATGLSCTDCPNPVAVAGVTTTYTVTTTNSFGCTDSASVTLYIGEIPDENIPDEPIVYCLGESLELCIPEGDLELWISPDGAVTIGPCLSFDNLTLADEGNYYAYLRIGDCRFGKQFRMEAAPEIEIENMTDFQSVCPDSTFVLSVEASNAEQYYWSPEEFLDCPVCPTTEGSVPQTATFDLTLTDEYGCTETATATVFVDDCMPRPAVGLPEGEQATPKDRLKCYPNPVSDILTIEMPYEGQKMIQLFDARGQLIRIMSYNNQIGYLSTSDLHAGAYLLRMLCDKGSFTEWIIVSK